MKIAALKEHKCYCCGSIINKGKNCFAYIINPSDPDKNEFDVIYTCLKCADEEACKTRIKRRDASAQTA
jgi:hypothetical protein